MNEYEHKVALSKCCNSIVVEDEIRTMDIVLTRSFDMICRECRKPVIPSEINWQPQYLKISNGIYRKIIYLKNLVV